MGRRGSVWSWSSLVAEHGTEGAFDALMDQTGLGSYSFVPPGPAPVTGAHEHHVPLEQGDIVHDETPSPGTTIRDILFSLDTECVSPLDYLLDEWWADEYVGDQRPWAGGMTVDNMPLAQLAEFGQRGGLSRWRREGKPIDRM